MEYWSKSYIARVLLDMSPIYHEESTRPKNLHDDYSTLDHSYNIETVALTIIFLMTSAKVIKKCILSL